jgi:hypothetical protein
MSEHSPRAIENPPVFHEKVKSAIDGINGELSRYSPAWTAIASAAIQSVRTDTEFPDWIKFEDESGRSYKYSNKFRERPDEQPQDSLTLRKGGSTLFLQVGHLSSDPSQLTEEAVLITGGKVFRDGLALERAHKIFSRFFPDGQADSKVA